MKILLLNVSANVGKTTLGQCLLQPKLQANYLSVATPSLADSGFQPCKTLTVNQFDDIHEFVLIHDSVIVDVSSAQTAAFLSQLKQYVGFHQDFDIVIIPTTAEFKTQLETQQTIQQLLTIGVEPNHIRLIFNKTSHDSNLGCPIDFAHLIETVKPLCKYPKFKTAIT